MATVTTTALSQAVAAPPSHKSNQRAIKKDDYDLVVIGAGASGLFAAGTASSLGFKTLLIEKAKTSKVSSSSSSSSTRIRHGRDDNHNDKDNINSPSLSPSSVAATIEEDIEFFVGGDCTNAACVPSKAVRSIARLAYNHRTALEATSSAAATTTTTTLFADGKDEKNKQQQQKSVDIVSGQKWLQLARDHAVNTVGKVRNRESPSRLTDSANLDLKFVKDCHFISPHELKLTVYDKSLWRNAAGQQQQQQRPPPIISPTKVNDVIVKGKKFLIATGSSPIIPHQLSQGAKQSRVPIYTYRTIFEPPHPNNNNDDDDDGSIWSLLNNNSNNNKKQIVIVGGGASACEIGQSLARLGGDDWDVSIVAPALLPSEDAALQIAALKLLINDGVRIHLHSRVVDVIPNDDDDGGGRAKGKVVIKNDSSSSSSSSPPRYIPVDALICCTGRSPNASLSTLKLSNANITYTPHTGITVTNHLRSTSAPHVYACGDCASVLKTDRRAIHAGWTGFHAVRNIFAPSFLRSVGRHEKVPRVVYTDPELASIGMSCKDGIRRYGRNDDGGGGLTSCRVDERDTDRADAECIERRQSIVGFINLRATTMNGRVMGATVCGPAAAEITNEIGLAIVNRLTVRSIARTLHSYPSHGYLLYRVAMAMAMGSSVSGLLAACGPVGRVLGGVVRVGEIVYRLLRRWGAMFLHGERRQRWRLRRKVREWEAEGCQRVLVLTERHLRGDDNEIVLDKSMLKENGTRLLSYLDAYDDDIIRQQLIGSSNYQDFNDWFMKK